MSCEDMSPADDVVAVGSVTAPVKPLTDWTGACVRNPLSLVSCDVLLGITVEEGKAPTSEAESVTAPVLPFTDATGAEVRKPLSF